MIHLTCLIHKLKLTLTKYLIIHPILLLISCLDAINRLLFNKDKHADSGLLKINDIQSKLCDATDSKSAYR